MRLLSTFGITGKFIAGWPAGACRPCDSAGIKPSVAGRLAATVPERPPAVAWSAWSRSAMVSDPVAGDVDDLAGLRVQVAEVVADDVPVGLLGPQMQPDQAGEYGLQARCERGRGGEAGNGGGVGAVTQAMPSP